MAANKTWEHLVGCFAECVDINNITKDGDDYSNLLIRRENVDNVVSVSGYYIGTQMLIGIHQGRTLTLVRDKRFSVQDKQIVPSTCPTGQLNGSVSKTTVYSSFPDVSIYASFSPDHRPEVS